MSAIKSTVLLPSLLFLGASISWFLFEAYTIRGFAKSGIYDFAIDSISDLGVAYRQVHNLKHYTVISHRAKTQNFNFLLNGSLFAVAQLILLLFTRNVASVEAKTVRNLRTLLSLLYVGGMVLLSQVHGGPREQKFGTIGWHWNGLALIAVAGNVNSIISGLVPNQIGSLDRNIVYRALSIALGVAGIFSFYQFQTLGTWNFQTKIGLWQRGIIYPIQLWQAVTAVGLIASALSGAVSQSKKKHA